jgi:transcriptional regulator with XRE-family HTH domain
MDLQLRAWRTYRALSQAELAERAGVTKQTIIALEKSGHRSPHPRTVRKLAKSLGIDPHQLYLASADGKEQNQ